MSSPGLSFVPRLVATRVARLAAVLLLVAVVAFALAKISPVDPVNAYLGIDIARVGPEQRALIAAREWSHLI